MIDSLFRETAAAAGWNDTAQIDVLLRYAAQAGSTATLRIFLDRERLAACDTDPFTDAEHQQAPSCGPAQVTRPYLSLTTSAGIYRFPRECPQMALADLPN